MFESAQFALAIFLLSATTNLSRKSILGISYLVSKSHKFGIILYSLIYLPGTIIHELSHFFTAAILGVRTGNISIFPVKEDNRLKLGSVEIQKTDFIRSSLIGLAPFITGAILLLYLTSILNIGSGIKIFEGLVNIFKHPINYLIILQIYSIIAISNTLFTSKEDRRHWPIVITFFLIAYLAIIISGKSFSINYQIVSNAKSILLGITGAFYIAIFLNLCIYITVSLVSKILEILLKRKIVYL
jgi:hypothetical protein